MCVFVNTWIFHRLKVKRNLFLISEKKEIDCYHCRFNPFQSILIPQSNKIKLQKNDEFWIGGEIVLGMQYAGFNYREQLLICKYHEISMTFD